MRYDIELSGTREPSCTLSLQRGPHGDVSLCVSRGGMSEKVRILDFKIEGSVIFNQSRLATFGLVPIVSARSELQKGLI